MADALSTDSRDFYERVIESNFSLPLFVFLNFNFEINIHTYNNRLKSRIRCPFFSHQLVSVCSSSPLFCFYMLRTNLINAPLVLLMMYPGLMLLGLSSSAGGLSTSLADQEKNGSYSNNDAKEAITALKMGSGWACFFYLVGSILAFAMSISYSPTIFGSNLEKNTLNTPVDIEPLRPTLAPSASASSP